MQKAPHEYWLRYLIGYVDYKYDSVVDTCRMYSLPAPTKEYYAEIRTRVMKSRPKPFRKDSRAVKSWCRKQRFASLVNNDKDVSKAREAVGEDKVRHALRAMILADVPRKDIPVYLESIVSRKMTPRAVKLFEHFFWNRDFLTLGEWKEYLEEEEYGRFYLSCRMKDPIWVLWRLGYRAEVSREDALDIVYHEAVQRFVETNSMKNDRHTALTAKLWSEQIFAALDHKSKTGDALSLVVDKLREVQIKLEATEAVDIETLSGGNHSLTGGLGDE